MIKRISKLFVQRHILKNIVLKELKVRYTGSVLGILWVIITPLLIMAAITFVFTKVAKTNIEHFPLFVLSALLPWMSFSASLSEASCSIVSSRNILSQFTISREILPISACLVNFTVLVFGLAVMLPLFLVFKIKIMPFIILLPVLIFLHFVFTAGLSLLLSCANVFFRDVVRLLEVGLMFWFWMTPVFYSIEMLPPELRWGCLINPMTPYITIYRNILFDAKFPDPQFIMLAVVQALIMFIIGYKVFIKYEASFLKRI